MQHVVKNMSFCEREFVIDGVKYAKSVVWLKASKHWLRIFNFLNMDVVSKIGLACQPSLCLLCLFVFLPLPFCAPVSICVCIDDRQAFCDELETMIQDQLKKGKTPTSLLALQQIADFMTTSMPSMYPAAPQGGMAALNMSKRRSERVCATF